MSDKIEIDLAKSFANEGVPVPFCGDFVLEEGLLPYPNATLQKISVNFNVVFEKPNVQVEGKVVCFVQGLCDRCLEEVSRQIELPFCQVFVKDGDVGDEESYRYAASVLDATKAVCDEIVLGLPTLFLCKDGCKGLCPKCGANKNKADCGCDTAKENALSALKNLKF